MKMFQLNGWLWLNFEKQIDPQPETKELSKQWTPKGEPTTKKAKTIPPAETYILFGKRQTKSSLSIFYKEKRIKSNLT